MTPHRTRFRRHHNNTTAKRASETADGSDILMLGGGPRSQPDEARGVDKNRASARTWMAGGVLTGERYSLSHYLVST